MESGFLGQAIRLSTAAISSVRLNEREPKPLRLVPLQPGVGQRRRCSPCDAYQRGMQSQTQAIAVPWDDNYASEWDSGEAEQQTPLQQQQQRQFAVTQRASKPLKINRDLLLVCISHPSIMFVHANDRCQLHAELQSVLLLCHIPHRRTWGCLNTAE